MVSTGNGSWIGVTAKGNCIDARTPRGDKSVRGAVLVLVLVVEEVEVVVVLVVAAATAAWLVAAPSAASSGRPELALNVMHM